MWQKKCKKRTPIWYNIINQTAKKGRPYKNNNLASEVKIMDLRDNMNLSRIKESDEEILKDIESMKDLYIYWKIIII